VEVDYRGYEVTVENLVRLLTGRLPETVPRWVGFLVPIRYVRIVIITFTGTGINNIVFNGKVTQKCKVTEAKSDGVLQNRGRCREESHHFGCRSRIIIVSFLICTVLYRYKPWCWGYVKPCKKYHFQ
jgi:hypothetical protein